MAVGGFKRLVLHGRTSCPKMSGSQEKTQSKKLTWYPGKKLYIEKMVGKNCWATKFESGYG